MTQLTGHMDFARCSTYEAGLKVCATDFDSFMHANLLVPFGMTASGYVATKEYNQHVADPHDAEGHPLDVRKPTDVDVARYGAAGLLHTTPTDYAKFLIEIIDPKPRDQFRLDRGTLAECCARRSKAATRRQVGARLAGRWSALPRTT